MLVVQVLIELRVDLDLLGVRTLTCLFLQILFHIERPVDTSAEPRAHGVEGAVGQVWLTLEILAT